MGERMRQGDERGNAVGRGRRTVANTLAVASPRSYRRWRGKWRDSLPTRAMAPLRKGG